MFTCTSTHANLQMCVYLLVPLLLKVKTKNINAQEECITIHLKYSVIIITEKITTKW